MTQNSEFTLKDHRQLLRSCIKSKIFEDIEGSKVDIQKIANDLSKKFGDVKRIINGFERIIKFLKDEKVGGSNLEKLAYQAWLSSKSVSHLCLPRDLNEQDFFELFVGVGRQKLIADISFKIYKEIYDKSSFWVRTKHPKKITQNGSSAGYALASNPLWKLEKGLLREGGRAELPSAALSLVSDISDNNYRGVMKCVEQHRLQEQALSDPGFAEVLAAVENEREQLGAQAIVSKYVKDCWVDKAHENELSERLSTLGPLWKEYNPLVGMTNKGKARRIDLDESGEKTLVFVKGHENTQGPAYKSIAEVLLEGGKFTVPTYQRPYEWERENIATLFDDLYSSDLEDEIPPLFLGTLLLQDGPAGDNTFQILDGQQRLLTISLVCIWICHLLKCNGLQKFADQIVKNYLATYDDLNSEVKPKIFPDPRDQESLKKLLKMSTSLAWNFEDWGQQPIIESSKALEDQFWNIDDIFGQELHSGGYLADYRAALELLLRLLQVSHVCRFVLSSEDDPFDTFQRLNHRGKKLQNSDLLRSMVLKKVDPTELKSYYENKWINLEELVGKSGEGDRSEYKKSRLDKFFTCFSKNRVPGTKKSQSVNTLTIYWKDATPDKIYEELVAFSSIYRMIYYFESSHAASAIKRFGPDIATDIMTLSLTNPPDDFGPFVIKILESLETGLCDKKAASDCIRLLSSWVVRNHSTATGSTTLFGLQSVFSLENWTRIEKSGFDSTELFKAMDRREFGLDQLTDVVFRLGVQTKSIYGSKIDRALVFALDTSELALARGKALKASGDIRLPHLSHFQIDHVAPQKWKDADHWKDMENLEEIINTIGNLVAVEEQLNKEAQRENFSDRADRFHDQSTFKLARDLRKLPTESRWKNEYGEVWGEKAIKGRSSEAAEALTAIFPFPYAKSVFYKPVDQT